MTMTTIHLNGHHRKALASIFRHPASHNVEWHDVLSLLNHVGTTSDRHGGGYDVTIGADHVGLPPAHGKNLTEEELRDLRSFLTKAGLSPDSGSDDAVVEHPLDHQCIVLIDHQQARLFGLGGAGGDPSAPRVLTPDDPDGSLRRIEHKQGNDDHDGGHAEEEDGYYERVSVDLKPAERIVVFSDGQGRSNAGAYLVDYLQRHHPAIAKRIVATERVDIAHLSDGEIIAAGAGLLNPA